MRPGVGCKVAGGRTAEVVHRDLAREVRWPDHVACPRGARVSRPQRAGPPHSALSAWCQPPPQPSRRRRRRHVGLLLLLLLLLLLGLGLGLGLGLSLSLSCLGDGVLLGFVLACGVVPPT